MLQKNTKKYRDCSAGVDTLKRAYATLLIKNRDEINFIKSVLILLYGNNVYFPLFCMHTIFYLIDKCILSALLKLVRCIVIGLFVRLSFSLSVGFRS